MQRSHVGAWRAGEGMGHASPCPMLGARGEASGFMHSKPSWAGKGHPPGTFPSPVLLMCASGRHKVVPVFRRGHLESHQAAHPVHLDLEGPAQH